MEFDQTVSVEEENNPVLKYQQCSYCNRSFFMGKLKYHLKLCNAQNPLIFSPRKTPKLTYDKSNISQNHDLFSNQEKRCVKCKTKLPSFLYQRHIDRCQANIIANSSLDHAGQQTDTKKSSTDVNFKQKQEITLPLIKRLEVHPDRVQKIMKQSYRVKLRDQLRCFRKAQEIKQVECSYCGRIFSKQASLRHLPICQTLKNNQKLRIALKKKRKGSSKNQKQGENHLKENQGRL